MDVDRTTAPDWLIPDREYARMEARRGRRHAYQQLTAERTALVVIDMIPFFVEADPLAQAAVPAIDDFARLLRSRGGTVAWVVPALSAPTPVEVEFRGPQVAAMYAGSGGPGAPRERIWAGLDVHEEDLVVEKTAASAFFPGRCRLSAELETRKIDTVLVAGAVTSVCCESTVRDAATLGYRVIMVPDLNIGGNFASRSATFTVVYRSFGDVRTAADVQLLLRS